MVALVKPRVHFFVDELYNAITSTDYNRMILVLTSLPPCAIKKIAVAYDRKYGKPLKIALEKVTIQHFEQFLVKLASGDRETEGAVDKKEVERDAKKLLASDPGQWLRTDDNIFSEIFTKKSYSHLREVRCLIFIWVY